MVPFYQAISFPSQTFSFISMYNNIPCCPSFSYWADQHFQAHTTPKAPQNDRHISLHHCPHSSFISLISSGSKSWAGEITKRKDSSNMPLHVDHRRGEMPKVRRQNKTGVSINRFCSSKAVTTAFLLEEEMSRWLIKLASKPCSAASITVLH